MRPSQVMMGVRVWAWRGVEVVWSSKLGTGDRTVVLLSSDAARCTWACEVEKGLCCRSPAGLWRLGDSEASCSGAILSILSFNVGSPGRGWREPRICMRVVEAGSKRQRAIWKSSGCFSLFVCSLW